MEVLIPVKNSTMTTIETWFIPFDILIIVFMTFLIILDLFFLFIIILDTTCHTVPMMLVANTCASLLALGCSLLSMYIFTLENDLKQIQYQDSLCIWRAYFSYVSGSLLQYSILLQAVYRYIIVVYPNRLFWQSAKFQLSVIGLTWIFSFAFPLAAIFTGEILYNVDNQICQLPLRLSFVVICMSFCIYTIPVSMIMSIYLKLVRYVHGMNKRVTPANTLLRAQRELKMTRRIVMLITILLTFGVPYMVFTFMSFFTTLPKYHFRIALLFGYISLLFVMIALFEFTDPLKASVTEKIKRRPNRIVATIT